MIKRSLFYKLVFALFFGLIFTYSYLNDNSSLATGSKIKLYVAEGATLGETITDLNTKNLIKSPLLFRVEAAIAGLSGKLQVGEYEIESGISNQKIIKLLQEGRSKQIVLTIPEGFTVRQTAAKIEAEGLGSADKFLALAKSYAPYPYMQNNNPEVMYLAEGYLYPSTYYLTSGMSEEQILKMLVAEFEQQLTPEIRAEAQKQQFTIQELVNLSALVEKEALFADEKEIIAAVFKKRLKIGMPLQSDTTIQYLFGEQKKEISIEDTKIASPYNTYQHVGLPPGPIASPSRATIEAVLAAAPTEYLYFVADLEGRHHFTRTYEEHLAEINRIHGS